MKDIETTDESQQPPLLAARIAGQSASPADPFDGRRLEPLLARRRDLVRQLDARRAGLIEALFIAVGNAPPEHRSPLLRLKRDLFNGRPPGGDWREMPSEVLPDSTRSALSQLASLATHLHAVDSDLDATYRQCSRAEDAFLVSTLDQPAFRRALALSSQPLASRLAAVRKTLLQGRGRKARRARASLVRYWSRGVFKLSPFSTFTRWTRAGWSPPAGGSARPDSPEGIQLVGCPGEWEERSLVRVRRYLVEQIEAAWLASPEVLRQRPVQLNDSLRHLEGDRHRLIKPVRWLPKSEDQNLRLRRIGGLPATVTIDPTIVEWLRQPVADASTLGDLEDKLCGEFGGDRERSRSLLDRLVAAGVLVLTAPWTSAGPRLESSIAHWLGGVEGDPGKDAFATWLAAESAFATCEEPVDAARSIDRAVEEAWLVAGRAAGYPATTTLHRYKRSETYEDVALAAADAPTPVLGRAEDATILLRQVEPWFRVLDLLSPRYDILLTLREIARREWPERDEVAALDLFEHALPLWPAVRRTLGEGADPSDGHGFNPLAVADLDKLQKQRRKLWRALPEMSLGDAGTAGEAVMSRRGLEALLDELPGWVTPLSGPCLFAQPIGGEGGRWMAHRVFEGTSRYPGRLLPILERADRRCIANGFRMGPGTGLRRLGQNPLGGEPVDLYSSQGDTLNVHEVPTERALWLPGETPPVAVDRGIPLASLRVRFDDSLPVLVDAAGWRLLPLHLGAATLAFMPSLIGFLAQFGPGEIRSRTPPQPRRTDGQVTHLDRVVLDRLVLARRRWVVPAAELADILQRPGAQARVGLDRWRRLHGVAARVFVIERVIFGDKQTFKPQFLDLRSPTFLELLAGIVERAGGPVEFEEMLPTPEAFPMDARGERWATELVLDSSCLRA
ncbi:MAG: lantibiotic dehydratase [Acidobacteriota bacterium]